MKNEILDVPIRHSFLDFLGKGETIIWEGQPSIKTSFYNGADESVDDYSQHIFFSLLFIGFLFLVFINQIPYMAVLYFVVMIIIGIVRPYWNRKRKQNYKYAITEKQIIFIFREKLYKSEELHAIPFSQIKDIIVVKKYDVENIKLEYATRHEEIPAFYNKKGLEKIGTIFLVLHQPELVPFETKDFSNNSRRHQPTLELLDDVEKVAKIIREGIRKNVS